MSITLIAWLLVFAALTILAFKRPAYGVALYMLTFFASPPFWWWGGPIRGYRWNLYSGIVLLVAVIIAETLQGRTAPKQLPLVKRVCWLVILLLANATLVHAFLAPNRRISGDVYFLLAKFVLLFFLILRSIRTREDLRIVLLSIVLGAGYVGYEVTINDRGSISGNRLEGVGVPAASTANGLACIMVTVLPIAGALFLVGNRWEKAAMLPIAPLILNVILLCNSRGAFLATILGAFMLVILSPAQIRRQVLKLTCFGAIAAWLLLGDPRIIERFMTTFASEEERDSSATSRLTYWSAAGRMIADHPLGTGGHGFKRVLGPQYLRQVGVDEPRSVHNGFLNEACQWGIQGLILRVLFLGTAGLLLLRQSRAAVRSGDEFRAILSIGLFAGLSGMLLQSMFGTFLDSEWGYWIPAVTAAIALLPAVGLAPSQASDSRVIIDQDPYYVTQALTHARR